MWRSLTSLLLLLAITRPVIAETPWYELEIIVFEQTNSAAMHSEAWPKDPGAPDTTGAVVPHYPAVGDPRPQTFQRLSPGEYRLADAEQLLRNSSRYRVLIHTGWRQPVREQAETAPVFVTSLPASESIAPDASADASLYAPNGVEGIIRLSIARYLHLEADLVYSQPPAPEATQTVTPSQEPIDPTFTDTAQTALTEVTLAPQRQRFRMTERRRMRSGELHYIDHPLFGILALATPYEPPVQNSEEHSAPTEPTATPQP